MDYLNIYNQLVMEKIAKAEEQGKMQAFVDFDKMSNEDLQKLILLAHAMKTGTPMGLGLMDSVLPRRRAGGRGLALLRQIDESQQKEASGNSSNKVDQEREQLKMLAIHQLNSMDDKELFHFMMLANALKISPGNIGYTKGALPEDNNS